MQRDLAGLERQSFDAIIVGGGIIGAALARDASRRGLSVALIEKHDFGSAASEAMSRTIHGGLRYLAQGRLGLVREALNERAIWLRTAPDFISPQSFILPLNGGLGAFKAKAAITLYEQLAGQKAVTLTRAQAWEQEPVLDLPALTGAIKYHDARVDEPHRLILAILQDAAGHGCVIANHLECTGIRLRAGTVEILCAKDTLSGTSLEIRSANVVNATGPWAQVLADTLLTGQRAVRLTASKGVHIITPAMTSGNAIALSGKGEHGFILPWMGMSLVGTTDEPCELPDCAVEPSAGELERLVNKITRLLPGSRSFLERPLGSYAGIRALPGTAGSTYTASREVAICDHAAEGAQGLISVYGGKWTTARRIAETIVDRLAFRLERKLRPCDTHTAMITQPEETAGIEAAVRRAPDSEMAVTSTDVWRRLGRHISCGSRNVRDEAARLIAAMRFPAGTD